MTNHKAAAQSIMIKLSRNANIKPIEIWYKSILQFESDSLMGSQVCK